MQNLEVIHRALDELAISLQQRDVVLQMLAFNREIMDQYRQVFEQLEQARKQSPNGKPKETAKP